MIFDPVQCSDGNKSRYSIRAIFLLWREFFRINTIIYTVDLILGKTVRITYRRLHGIADRHGDDLLCFESELHNALFDTREYSISHAVSRKQMHDPLPLKPDGEKHMQCGSNVCMYHAWLFFLYHSPDIFEFFIITAITYV